MAVAFEIIEFRKNIIPIGSKNGINLSFQALEKFDPDTIEVFLSGLFLSKNLDFIIQPDNKTFKIVLEPNDPTRLNVPPLQDESLRINYIAC